MNQNHRLNAKPAILLNRIIDASVKQLKLKGATVLNMFLKSSRIVNKTRRIVQRYSMLRVREKRKLLKATPKQI